VLVLVELDSVGDADDANIEEVDDDAEDVNDFGDSVSDDCKANPCSTQKLR
jgi:hypothetical protein